MLRLVETRTTSSSDPSGFSFLSTCSGSRAQSFATPYEPTVVLAELLLFTDISANVNAPFIILLIHRIAAPYGIFQIRKVSFSPLCL